MTLKGEETKFPWGRICSGQYSIQYSRQIQWSCVPQAGEERSEDGC